MTAQGWLQIAVYLAVLFALAPLLGGYMAKVYTDAPFLLGRLLGPIERFSYRILRVNPDNDQNWKQYARSLIIFSFAGWLALYLILRTQSVHPLNPQGFKAAPWDVTLSTTSSFLTNTNWQYYGGETTLSYFSQMFGLAVQNFLSAGVGIVTVIALIRGITRRSGNGLGNFYKDLVRTLLYVLLPISFIAAIVLVSQGVIDNFSHYLTTSGFDGNSASLALGPVASQEAIKILGTNGGGFFNTNSAMPFENPTGFSNLVQMLMILVIPVGLTFTYGKMVGRRRQGYAILAAMMIMFAGGVAVAYAAEAHGSPAQHAAGLHTAAYKGSTGGNLEGKEQRFGIANSALYDTLSTDTSCGCVNASIESFTGIGGLVPFSNLSVSEVIFGGVGTGLYSMLLFVIISVFIGGLMVGRTPEFLGKKIEAREIKLAALGSLFTPLFVLLASSVAVADPSGRASISANALTAAGKHAPQGFSESLYAYLSQANNNGSAFAGYTGFVQPNAGNVGSHGIRFADILGSLTMIFARYAPIVLVLAIAGTLAGKKVSPAGLGTMRTDNPTFVVLLIGVIILVGALTFFPALLLGPVVQGLTTHLY